MLNAKAAAAQSTSIAEKTAAAHRAAQKKGETNRRKRAHEAHVTFVKEMRQDIEESINEAVKKGKRKVEYDVVWGADSPVQARASYDGHGYKADLDFELRHLRALGFHIEVIEASVQHVNINDLTGNDTTYYSHRVYWKITW